MDPRHLCIDERLKTDVCIYCFGEARTRDHVPPKVFLDEPYPSQLPVVDACEACNSGSSLDEQYLSCFLECVLCGGSDPDRLQRPKIKRILSENANLRQRIQASMKQGGEDAMLWEPENSRVQKVILKLSTGHAAYELFTQSEKPITSNSSRCWRCQSNRGLILRLVRGVNLRVGRRSEVELSSGLAAQRQTSSPKSENGSSCSQVDTVTQSVL
jgi:hypothetical protein